MAKKASKPSAKRPSPKSNGAAPPSKWAVLIYMAAEMTEELDMHAVRDLREMERAQIAAGVRVVVQINRHWPKRPQRYEIEKGGARLLEADIADLNTGSGKTLSNFLTFAWKAAPADHYFLILWGHSYGLGFGRDHDDALTLPELRRSLRTLQRLRSGLPLDLLGANACAMSYAEAAYELKDVASFMVASQIAVPYAGWPFESILGRITGASTAVDIGQLVVDRYVTAFGGVSAARQVAMTLLTLSLGDALKRAFTTLSRSLDDIVRSADAGTGDRLEYVRAVFRSTAAGDVRPLLDLNDLCQRLMALCDDLLILQPQAAVEVQALQAASAAMATLLGQGPTYVNGSPTARAHAQAFVAFHKAHPELADLRGVGIYAPFVTDLADLIRLGLDEGDAQTGRTRYARLGLVRRTGWERLVYETLRAGLPADIVTNIESSGAVSVADRRDVSQMLTSVDSMLDVLDRRISATRLKALAALASPGGLPSLSSTQQQISPAQTQRRGLQLVRHDVLEKALSDLLNPSGTTISQPAAAAAAAIGAATLAAVAGGAGGVGPSQTAQASATSAATAAAQAAIAASVAAASATRAAVATAAALARPTFDGLEDMVADVERSVRRTLTNGTFGLGPGPSAIALAPSAARTHGGFSKPADGHGGPIKPADAHGGPVKPADRHGAPTNGMTSNLPATGANGAGASPSAIVADLFSQVGGAMAQLESAIADAETIAALATLPPAGLSGPPPHTQIERAFRVLADASTDLRRTLRRVLGHPLYGFGPGPEALEMEDRRELARAGGMSSRGLTLL